MKRNTKTQNTQSIIHSDPEILGGTPVFVGTRVPLRNLIDYLERGCSVNQFLDQFPSVSRDQAVAALEVAHDFLAGFAGPLGSVLLQISKLPESEREVLAKWLKAEISDERKWQRSFAASRDRLSELADEAREDYSSGRTQVLDPDKL